MRNFKCWHQIEAADSGNNITEPLVGNNSDLSDTCQFLNDGARLRRLKRATTL